MAQISSGPSVARTDALARGTLRLPDAIAISVSVLAPGMAMLLNVSGVAATSGGSTPLAFLLGRVACLAPPLLGLGGPPADGVGRLRLHLRQPQPRPGRRLHGRLALLLRHDLLRPDDHVRRG